MKKIPIPLMFVLVAFIACVQPPSWPRWRGAKGDGVSKETGWNPLALQGGAKVLWTADVGFGYSNIAIAGNRLYATGQDKKTNALDFSCFDATTGELIWQRTFPTVRPPESTPVVDGDQVYGIAIDDKLFCLRSADGKIVWQKDMIRDFHMMSGGYGWANSPVVVGDLIILNAGKAGMALNRTDGSLAWDSSAGLLTICTYASVVPFDIAGTKCALIFGPKTLSAVEVSTGKERWSSPVTFTYDTNVVTDPIIYGDEAYYATVDHSVALQIVGDKPRELWRAEKLRGALATPVLVNGDLFGSDWPTSLGNWEWAAFLRLDWPFQCLDWKTGAVMWEKSMKYVSLMAAGGKLIMLEANGTLHVAEATPREYRELSSADVFGGGNKPRLFVTPPVLCGGRVYCRNYAGDLVCIDVSK
jgi:outer membrane protein assembly factor BamB